MCFWSTHCSVTGNREKGKTLSWKVGTTVQMVSPTLCSKLFAEHMGTVGTGYPGRAFEEIWNLHTISRIRDVNGDGSCLLLTGRIGLARVQEQTCIHVEAQPTWIDLTRCQAPASAVMVQPLSLPLSLNSSRTWWIHCMCRYTLQCDLTPQLLWAAPEETHPGLFSTWFHHPLPLIE